MQFNEIYEKTVYAFEHDEVYELLTGQKGYAYQAPRYVASVPTCDEFIFRDGIYPYYKSLSTNDKQGFLLKLTNALKKMIHSDDAVMVWWALSLLYGQKLSEDKYKDSLFIFSDLFWDTLSTALKNNKSALVSNQSYMGRGRLEGLWSEVRRIAFLLEKDYGYVLIGDY